MQVCEDVGKSRFTVFFAIICGPGGWKSNLAKVAGAKPAGQMREEKLHAVVARSTLVPSQNATYCVGHTTQYVSVSLILKSRKQPKFWQPSSF